ncbi:BBE domain-containing protein [Pseudoalteromonas luteoviolacea]|uniref:FAD/FMN-containing dehydrogenase n=1 Tax=Pseudoalteromonas luteoviolacea (strain 2ta16) TaxID=1353533 RepID=V4HV53_PSEL2|nr:BBE domain-containing protein [Pseudoalteromonas luteoviolacea]ESP93678.1 FAD/FMN-containing dehydrogenase [Pseudoalteromonas luteoviolacea 2ta16]KZN41204.1 hypothetical protein N483_16465 [Pseudoalteromonas luteoviolacea NCIMB 1944]
MNKNDRMAQPTLSDRQGFNRRWFANNADLKVYRPTSRAEVVLAFQDIIDAKDIEPHEVQITCGRHCYESFVYNGETKAIIDVGSLNGFEYSKKSDTIEMEIGLSNWEMYRVLNNMYKRTLPAGSCYSVGLGGHVTGGGYGLLSRMYGLAMDYLVGVYIVVQNSSGDAEELYCDQDQHCDLFWGVKGGGGGQFGIITKLIFKDAPPSPERMYTINFSWDWQDENGDYLSQEQFTQIIRLFEKSFCDQDPQTWHVWANMLLNHKDAKNISITAFVYYIPEYHGDWAAFELKERNKFSAILKKANQIKLLSKGDFTLFGHPHIPSSRGLNSYANNLKDNFIDYTLRDYTYLNGTQQVSPSGPNSFGKYKSAYLTKYWTEHMINSAYAFLRKPISYQDGDHATRADMARSLIQIDSYGGKINTVEPKDTAIVQRSSIMKLQYQTYWDNKMPPGLDNTAQADAHVNWLNDMYKTIYAVSGGVPDPRFSDRVDGCYYNYPDVDLGSIKNGPESLEHALMLYFGDNLPRLKQVKAKYNPQGWFGNVQSVQTYCQEITTENAQSKSKSKAKNM